MSENKLNEMMDEDQSDMGIPEESIEENLKRYKEITAMKENKIPQDERE